MSGLTRLIREIHRRSLWQVLLVYVGASWVVLEAADVMVTRLALPEWVYGAAIVLLLVGLPIVLATAFVQEGAPLVSRRDPTLLPGAAAVTAETQPPRGASRLFTWRNAILGGVLAFALWGVVAAAWLMLGFPGLLLKAEATDFFNAGDRVVVAEFENETEQQALALAVREAVVTDLDQSPYVNVAGRARLREVLERMRLPDTARVDADVALEIARREGYPAVIAGSVTPLGTGYQLTARILEAATAEVAVRIRETARDGGEVVEAVERLAHLVRGHLGESLRSVRRSRPLPSVTTASLEALELYARAMDYGHRGDPGSAIPLLQQALELDTAFAAAHRALGVNYAYYGNQAAAQRHADLAHRFSERLVDRERFMTGAYYHYYRNRLDSAAHYYKLAIDRHPDLSAAVHNLGFTYALMGRYEEALTLIRRAVELDPDASRGYMNVVELARILGRHELADSALGVLRARFPKSPDALWTAAVDAYYTDDLAEMERVSRELANDPSEANRVWGLWLLCIPAALDGQVVRAVAYADSAAELGMEAGLSEAAYTGVWTIAHLASAAGMPELARPYLQKVQAHASQETSPFFKYLALGFIGQGYALASDLEEARAVLALMDSLAEAEDFRPPGIGESVRALIGLHEDRAEASLEHLQRARVANYGLLFRPDRLMLADAYAALGRLAEAAAHYDTLTSTYPLDWRDMAVDAPLRPLAHERLGSIYLTLGDTAAAVRHLAAFTELWKDADPELQPRVEAARRAISALSPDQ